MNAVRKTVAVLALSLMLGTNSLMTDVSAKTRLESLNDPLTVQLQTAIDGETVETGTPFKAVLTEEYEYDGQTLPAGTVFEGQVHKTKESRHVMRPGYVILGVNQVILPNGRTVAFEPTDPENLSDTLYHKDSNNPRKVAKNSWPFAAVNAAVAVPLKYAGGWSSMQAFPVAMAAKMGLGVAREYYRDDKPKDRPNGHKIGYGILVGTSLPGICFVLANRPEPELNPGDNVEIHLDSTGLGELFAYSEEPGEEKKVSGRFLPASE